MSIYPNPTAGEVQVMGAAGEVSEVLVLDMKGRQVAKFEHTDRFDISGLPSGAYIVRLRTRSGEDANDITYLKLVKE
ncbi:MAG: T9SS type A sorting domain-containing protein [Bacteroidales bacterium]|nr:T9SS type A sorting domain-containing protein [Bacteroidales bacterium]